MKNESIEIIHKMALTMSKNLEPSIKKRIDNAIARVEVKYKNSPFIKHEELIFEACKSYLYCLEYYKEELNNFEEYLDYAIYNKIICYYRNTNPHIYYMNEETKSYHYHLLNSFEEQNRLIKIRELMTPSEFMKYVTAL